MQADILIMNRLYEQSRKRRQQTRAALPITQPSPSTQLIKPQAMQPVPTVQQQGKLLDDVIKLAAQIGWEAFKAKWEHVSPDSRKVWDLGVKLAASPFVTPLGQKVGVGLCIASLTAGFNDMDEEAGG